MLLAPVLLENRKESEPFDIDIGASCAADHILKFRDLDLFAMAIERMHDDRGCRKVESLSKRRGGDRHLQHAVAQEALDLLSVGGRQRTVMKRDADSQAFQDVAVGTEPLLTERDRSLQQRRIRRE